MTILRSWAARAPLVWLFAAIAAGVAIADGATLPPTPLACGLGIALGVLWVAVRRRTGTFATAVIAALLLGAFATRSQGIPPAPVQPCGEAGELWRARVLHVRGREIDAATGHLRRPALLELLAQRCGDLWQPAAGCISTRLWGGPAPACGDVVEVRLRLEPVGFRRNPTDPDPVLLARRDGIGGRAVARSPFALVRPATGVRAAIDRARDRAAERFESRLPPRLAALAKALSTGDQSAVDDEMREAWSSSGLAHLLSVSGLHVTLVGGLAYILLAHLLALVPGLAERWSARRTAAMLTLPVVAGFCLWAGAPPPAVRATVMGGAVLAGVVVNRPGAAVNAAGLAGAALLLLSPATLYDPGFLLSFVAVLFLLALPSPPAAMAGLGARLRRLVVGLTTASVVASLATAPITAHYFGRVSLVAPLTNLVGVPLGSAVATPLALLYTLASSVSGTFGAFVAWLLEWTLGLLQALAQKSAALPGAAIDLPGPTAAQMGIYFATLTATLAAARSRAARKLVAVGLLALATSVVLRLAAPTGRGLMTLWHPYVGQGDATVVHLPEGGIVLVDAGGSFEPGGPDPGRRTLAPLLRQAGIRRIDVAVSTHAHPDHVEGFRYLAAHIPIRELWWSGAGEEMPSMRALIDAVRRQGGGVRTAAELPRASTREGVRFEVLHPRPGPEAEGLPYYPQFSLNDNSLVLRLVFGQRSVLLAGDIESAAEGLIGPAVGATDVLKSPHHGSRTSSTSTLLAALRPRLVVVSAGYNNRFGFPDPEVIERYGACGAVVLRTDADGLVEITTDGRHLTAVTARGQRLEF